MFALPRVPLQGWVGGGAFVRLRCNRVPLQGRVGGGAFVCLRC